MSLSNESRSRISAFARSASSFRPIRSSVSSASTGVMRRESPYQSRAVRLTGFSSSCPQAYRAYPRQQWSISSRTCAVRAARLTAAGSGGLGPKAADVVRPAASMTRTARFIGFLRRIDPLPGDLGAFSSRFRRAGLDSDASGMTATESFLRARDFLIANGQDYERARSGFRWPELSEFNWAYDWFDVLARGNSREALRVVGDDGTEARRTFSELSETSGRVAAFLHRTGLRRGDRVLVMLGNVAALWEITLGAMKLGVVVSPASTLLTPADPAHRIERGRMRGVVTDEAGVERFAAVPGDDRRILVGGRSSGWAAYDDASAEPAGFRPEGTTRADDPLLLYFTSGTTARPKLALH